MIINKNTVTYCFRHAYVKTDYRYGNVLNVEKYRVWNVFRFPIRIQSCNTRIFFGLKNGSLGNSGSFYVRLQTGLEPRYEDAIKA